MSNQLRFINADRSFCHFYGEFLDLLFCFNFHSKSLLLLLVTIIVLRMLVVLGYRWVANCLCRLALPMRFWPYRSIGWWLKMAFILSLTEFNFISKKLLAGHRLFIRKCCFARDSACISWDKFGNWLCYLIYCFEFRGYGPDMHGVSSWSFLKYFIFWFCKLYSN